MEGLVVLLGRGASPWGGELWSTMFGCPQECKDPNYPTEHCIMIRSVLLRSPASGFKAVADLCILPASFWENTLFNLFSLSHSPGCVQTGGNTSVINGEGQAGSLCPRQPHTHYNSRLRTAVSMPTPEITDCIWQHRPDEKPLGCCHGWGGRCPSHEWGYGQWT